MNYMNHTKQQELSVPSIRRRDHAGTARGYADLGKKMALLPFQVIFLLLFTFPLWAPVLFILAWIYTKYL